MPSPVKLKRIEARKIITREGATMGEFPAETLVLSARLVGQT
jgi:hypothetical protein